VELDRLTADLRRLFDVERERERERERKKTSTPRCSPAARKWCARCAACADFHADLTEFNGEHDHVHLLVEYPPKVSVSTLVNSLKGVSSRRLRRDFTGPMNRASMHGRFWSPSYLAASCGGAPLSIIRQYVEQQRRPDQGRG
jgi:putative transposase